MGDAASAQERGLAALERARALDKAGKTKEAIVPYKVCTCVCLLQSESTLTRIHAYTCVHKESGSFLAYSRYWGGWFQAYLGGGSSFGGSYACAL